jgi:hypothetical protein
MLTNLAKLKSMLSITDDSENISLGLILAGVDAGIKKFCKRDLEWQAYTEIVSGQGTADFWTRQRPIGPLVQATGTVTSSGTTVTVTTGIFTAAMVGQPITDGTQQVTITGFTSATVVTVNAAPNPTWLNTPVNVCGISLWLDSHGRGGQNPAAFGTTTQLIQGKDFIAIADGPSNLSTSGLVRRIGTYSWPNQFGGGIIYPSGIRQYTLSGWDRGVVWPMGDGNIKIQYFAGYQVIPADIVTACHLLCACIRNERMQGKPIASETYIDYTIQLATSPPAGAPPEMDSVRGLLLPYRESSL